MADSNSRIEALQVWLTRSAGLELAGDLALEVNAEGRVLASQFRYSPAFLAGENVTPLDPKHLPESVPTMVEPYVGLLPCFADALPDRWGQYAANKLMGTGVKDELTHLLSRSPVAIGGLRFARLGEVPVETDASELMGPDACAFLAPAVRAVEEDADVSGFGPLKLAMQPGFSAGGARPKLLASDDNGLWLVKYPSKDDTADISRLEQTCLHIAQQAGLAVPETRLIEVPESPFHALAVKRFDVDAEGNFMPMLSMASLLGDPPAASWSDLVRVVREYSVAPDADCEHLYQRMLLDAWVHNTDNHLRNFCLIMTKDGWRLSPSYDVVPTLTAGAYHFLNFGYSSVPPTSRESWLVMGKAFHLSAAKAEELYDRAEAACSANKDLLKIKGSESN